MRSSTELTLEILGHDPAGVRLVRGLALASTADACDLKQHQHQQQRQQL
jgi:hypothetical protein